MSGIRPRAVFDCNTLLQAVVSPNGPAAHCLAMVEEGRVTLVTSQAVLAEARDVLNRPFVRDRLPPTPLEQVNAFIDRIRRSSIYYREVPEGPPYERDLKDQPYMDLAVAAAADYLVTRDKDLLSLAAAQATPLEPPANPNAAGVRPRR